MRSTECTSSYLTVDSRVGLLFLVDCVYDVVTMVAILFVTQRDYA